VSAPGHEILEAARVQAGMSFDELWMAYFALGGTSSPEIVRSYLAGVGTQAMDYDVLAQAINESYVEAGGDHPVPYREDLI